MTQDRSPVLLVHGLSGSHRWWRKTEVPRRRLRAVDLPRRGDPVTWLAGELDGPTAVVGHSLGGLTAARLAATLPELVPALVLVAPVGAPSPLPRYVGGLARAAWDAPAALRAVVAADALRTGPLALAAGAWQATRAAFAGSVEAPTLLVWGERDRLVPPALAPFWREAIPTARVEVIAGAGHAPMLEAPSRFNELLRDFLDSLGV